MTYLNISQTAKELRISRPTVYQLIRRGRLTAIRNPAYVTGRGGAVLIAKEQVDALKPLSP